MVYPIAILKDGKRAEAFLNYKWIAPEDTDRKTILCGELKPELEEVEIYHLTV